MATSSDRKPTTRYSGKFEPSPTIVNYVRRRLQSADTNAKSSGAARRNDEEARDILFKSMTNLVCFFEMIATHPEAFEFAKRDVAELLGLGRHLLEQDPSDSFLRAHLMRIERAAGRDKDGKIEAAAWRRINSVAKLLDSNIGRLIGAILFSVPSEENVITDNIGKDPRLVTLQVLQDMVAYKVLEILTRDESSDYIPPIVDSAQRDFETVRHWIAFACRNAFSDLGRFGEYRRKLPPTPPHPDALSQPFGVSHKDFHE